MTKLYTERDIMALDKAGNYYCKHVSAMTSEKLHSKSDIAAELAHRDYEIDKLKAQVEQLREDSLVAFGDGFYDGYLHYAKLCGDLEFTDDVMRQSELAEADSIFGKRVGSSVRVAEIKAQAIEDFADELIGFHNLHSYVRVVIYSRECANQLRQQAKGE